MDRLGRLWKQWTIGAVALLMFALAALACLTMIALVVAVVGMLAWIVGGALGWSSPASILPDRDGASLLLWSAVIWLPLSVGILLPDIARMFADRFREIEDSKRNAELAPYRQGRAKP